MNLLQFVLGKTWGTTDQVPATIRDQIVAEVAAIPDAETYQEGFRQAHTVEEFDVWLQRLGPHAK